MKQCWLKPVKHFKPFSTSNLLRQAAPAQQFHIEDRKDKGFVILKLNRAPVNSLNLEFLTELTIQLEKLEQAKDIKGVILTSNLPNIFSAGLDIMEMYQPKPERIRMFWTALQDFWIKLYGSNKIFIAAINVLLFKISYFLLSFSLVPVPKIKNSLTWSKKVDSEYLKINTSRTLFKIKHPWPWDPLFDQFSLFLHRLHYTDVH